MLFLTRSHEVHEGGTKNPLRPLHLCRLSVERGIWQRTANAEWERDQPSESRGGLGETARFRVRLTGSAAAGVGREAIHVHSEAVPVHVHEDTNGIRNQKTGGDVRETVVVCGNVNGWKSNLCAPAPQREKNKFHQLGDAADRCPFMRGPTRAAHRWRRPRKTHPFPARTRGSARRLRSRG